VTQPDIQHRTFEFARRIVRLAAAMRDGRVERQMISQVLRAGTSVGANVEEAQAGQSRADFLSKMSIACKEAREVNYWLRLFLAEDLAPAEVLQELVNESDQILRIISAIVISTRKNNPNN